MFFFVVVFVLCLILSLFNKIEIKIDCWIVRKTHGSYFFCRLCNSLRAMNRSKTTSIYGITCMMVNVNTVHIPAFKKLSHKRVKKTKKKKKKSGVIFCRWVDVDVILCADALKDLRLKIHKFSLSSKDWTKILRHISSDILRQKRAFIPNSSFLDNTKNTMENVLNILKGISKNFLCKNQKKRISYAFHFSFLSSLTLVIGLHRIRTSFDGTLKQYLILTEQNINSCFVNWQDQPTHILVHIYTQSEHHKQIWR